MKIDKLTNLGPLLLLLTAALMSSGCSTLGGFLGRSETNSSLNTPVESYPSDQGSYGVYGAYGGASYAGGSGSC